MEVSLAKKVILTKLDFKARIPNIINSLSAYELVFIDGPIPMEYKGPAEHAPSGPTFNGWFPIVDSKFDLNNTSPGINRIKEYWDETFVGIITFSFGSVIAGLAYNILKPEFMICINGFPRAFENVTGKLLKISGYRDKVYSDVVASGGEGISFDGSHAYNEREFGNIAKLSGKIADWLHPELEYKYSVNKYELTFIKNSSLVGKMKIKLQIKEATDQVIFDSNTNINVYKAFAGDFSAKITNGPKLILQFETQLPITDLYLEFTITGDFSFPCLKYQKAPILLTTLCINEQFVFFSTYEEYKEIVDGKEYLGQKFKEIGMVPAIFNIFSVPIE
ncbi:hypothetical protein HDV01_003052 [Terramyces sp. JEL0728]|nr:hypothetical protein HDV01_003052 [Terramyces sp. JEL0728]